MMSQSFVCLLCLLCLHIELCLIDIKNGILTSASHLIIILFALSYLKSFYSSFLCFCHTC